MSSPALTETVCSGELIAAMHAWRVVKYGDLGFDGALRVACSLPVLIQFVAVGRDTPRMAHASFSVMLYASMFITHKKRPPMATL
jgi:hypothetical protein